MIVLNSIQKDLLTWAHELFGHPGVSRMYNTLKPYVTWYGMQKDTVEYVKKCHTCQMEKTNKKTYGKLLPTSVDVDIVPFQVIAIDVVGPMRTVSDDDGVEYTHILSTFVHPICPTPF